MKGRSCAELRGVFGVRLHQFLSFTPLFRRSAAFGGETAFFPGCSMIARDPELALNVFRYLRGVDPALGLFGGCCAYPAAALGNENRFSRYRETLLSGFRAAGVRRLIVCCPNCSETFRTIGGPEIVSVWQVLDAHPPEAGRALSLPPMVLHDPCPTRRDPAAQEAVRRVLGRLGVRFEEYPSNRARALCCGKAGMLLYLNPEKGREVLMRRVSQSGRRDVLTCCFACAESFRSVGLRSVHALELIFPGSGGFRGLEGAAGAERAWLNRWRMMRRIRRIQEGAA